MILDESHRLIREIARRFARESLAPFSAEWDRTGEFPRAAIKGLGELGFLGVTIPEEYGGAGADYLSLALALEEIAAGDCSVSTVMSGHNSVGVNPIFAFGTPEQKERYVKPLARGHMLACFCLTEPQGGSDASQLKTRAVKTGTGYVLNGVKQFITSGSQADLAVVFASTDPEKGPKGITAFVVPTDSPGFKVIRKEDKMGQRASDTCQIAFDNVAVPADMRLGEQGQGYRIALSNEQGCHCGHWIESRHRCGDRRRPCG